jgi:hypothetical protein
MSMVRLAIDFENTSQTWWDEGGRDLWEGMLEGFDNNSVLLERSIAESWLAEAAKLPGWEGGPEYSPHPIRIVDVDEDEEL